MNSCTIKVDGKNEQLDILDTAGQEQFAALRHHWIREAEAFLLVYAVNSQRTFKHADTLYKTILRNKVDQRIDLVLIGNKSDLPAPHEVSYDMGKHLAQQWGVPFIETSAKTGDNVQEAFETLVKEIKKKDKGVVKDPDFPDPNPTPGPCNGCCQIL